MNDVIYKLLTEEDYLSFKKFSIHIGPNKCIDMFLTLEQVEDAKQKYSDSTKLYLLHIDTNSLGLSKIKYISDTIVRFYGILYEIDVIDVIDVTIV